MKPSVFKGVMLGVTVSLITAVLHAVWCIVWANCSVNGSLVGVPATIYNMVFNFWTFPFYGLMGASEGHITILGQILMYGVPVASAAAGYLSAKYNIDLVDKLQRAVYEKPDAEE